MEAKSRRSAATLPTLIDIEALAEHLGVTIHHVRRLVQERRVPHVKVGPFVRFDPLEISRWIDDQRVSVFGAGTRGR